VPTSRTSLDHLRFCLGFPGVEVSVADHSWSLVVSTTCRHLVGGRCSIHGRPERPDICRYYDAWSCSYRAQFSPDSAVADPRAGADEWALLVSCFRFDPLGDVVEMLTAEGIGCVLAAGVPADQLVAAAR
jgi:hypothetical protein